MTWPTVKLVDVAEFVRGITFKPTDVVDLGLPNTVGCMRTKNVQDELDLLDVWGIDKNFIKNTKQILRKGDILVSSANSWNLVGKGCWVPQLKYDSTFGGFVSVLRAKPEKIDTKYLYYWYRSARIQNTVRSFGQKTTNISNLNLERCLELELLLPPLAEQQRIAAILDKAEEIKRKREQAIAKLDELAQSTFVEMFGDPITNTRNFKKQTLGELIKIKSGDFLPATSMDTSGKYPVYGGNGINGYHNEYMFKDKKIVIGRVGAYCGCVHITNEKSWVTDNALYVENYDSKLDFEYLAFALDMVNLNKVSSQSGQPLVSGARIYRVEIIIPALENQLFFSKILLSIRKLKCEIVIALERHKRLIESLQHHAFTTGFRA